jgi:hypothetical protein
LDELLAKESEWFREGMEEEEEEEGKAEEKKKKLKNHGKGPSETTTKGAGNI